MKTASIATLGIILNHHEAYGSGYSDWGYTAWSLRLTGLAMVGYAMLRGFMGHR